MENNEIYDLLAKGEVRLKSNMGIVPYHAGFTFKPERIEESLRKDKRFKLISFAAEEEDMPDEAVACFIAEIEYQEDTYSVILDILSTKDLDLRNFGFANRIDDESMEAAGKPEFYMQSTLEFYDDSVNSFHFQLKVMDAIVAEASLVIDFMSYRLLSAKWLKMTAQSLVPPSSDYLYTIHYVYDEDKNGENVYWMHSHGLHRCGFTELEMVNIKQGAEQMSTLLNTIIKNFLTDPKPEMEQFKIGYDGMDLNICWQRWEDALARLPKDILGGIGDREEENNVHASPSGILFAVEEKELISPEIYAKTLADNPIFFITNEETARMSALAKERFSLFRRIYEKENGGKEEKKGFLKKIFDKKEEPKWRFLVKLGLMVDGGEEDSDREHMWFEVEAISEECITGKLINQPYWIANLHEGDVNKYPFELLTDWVIYGPGTSYNPDTIYELV